MDNVFDQMNGWNIMIFNASQHELNESTTKKIRPPTKIRIRKERWLRLTLGR